MRLDQLKDLTTPQREALYRRTAYEFRPETADEAFREFNFPWAI